MACIEPFEKSIGTGIFFISCEFLGSYSIKYNNFKYPNCYNGKKLI